MPRAVWRGAISFGLVTVPVRLYPAIRRKAVRFRELDRVTGQRVRHQRVRAEPVSPEPVSPEPVSPEPVSPEPVSPEPVSPDPVSPEPVDAGPDETPEPGRADHDRASLGRQPSPPPLRDDRPPAEAEPAPAPRREVGREEVVRGYELSPGQYVEVTDQELEELAAEPGGRHKRIDVEQFVSRRDLDPIFFESSYYVVPDQAVTRPFAVLLRAMQETNRAAICWLTLRSRRHLAALQPGDGLMLLTTLLFSDEIVPVAGLRPLLPEDLHEREMQMAELLVDTLAGPWEPERYHDEYRQRLLALIEERASSEGLLEEREAEMPPASGVEELMAALTASVEAARARRQAEEGRPKPARRRKGA